MAFTTSREEMAWAAGFFDGEGHVGSYTYGKDRRRETTIAMPQVDRRVLDRFAAAVGCGNVYGPIARRQTDRPGSQPQYRYRLGGHPFVQAVCAMLWQWLSPVKREQFRLALTAETPRAHNRHRVAVCEHGVRRPLKRCGPCRREYARRYYAEHLGTERATRRLAVAMLAA